MMPNYTDSKLSSLQRQHATLRAVIAKMEKNDDLPQYRGPWRFGALRRYRQIWKQLDLKDGVLHRNYFPGPRQEMRRLKILPESLIAEVLKQLRDDPLAGHLGEDKTIDIESEQDTTGINLHTMSSGLSRVVQNANGDKGLLIPRGHLFNPFQLEAPLKCWQLIF
jgi:hypothetical protein